MCCFAQKVKVLNMTRNVLIQPAQGPQDGGTFARAPGLAKISGGCGRADMDPDTTHLFTTRHLRDPSFVLSSRLFAFAEASISRNNTLTPFRLSLSQQTLSGSRTLKGDLRDSMARPDRLPGLLAVRYSTAQETGWPASVDEEVGIKSKVYKLMPRLNGG